MLTVSPAQITVELGTWFTSGFGLVVINTEVVLVQVPSVPTTVNVVELPGLTLACDDFPP
jgi:hypothetical protein